MTRTAHSNIHSRNIFPEGLSCCRYTHHPSIIVLSFTWDASACLSLAHPDTHQPKQQPSHLFRRAGSAESSQRLIMMLKQHKCLHQAPMRHRLAVVPVRAAVVAPQVSQKTRAKPARKSTCQHEFKLCVLCLYLMSVIGETPLAADNVCVETSRHGHS
jgi:hypothetical protein